MITITLDKDKKIYFVSDFHLGVPTYEKSLVRERAIVQWLEHIRHDAQELFLLGDIFDFWFEYKKVVPKGFVRLMGKLAELSDSGVVIRFFTGNHDLWTFGYLEQEIGCKIYRNPETFSINNKLFIVGHGDGIGPHNKNFKLLKKIFLNAYCQRMFAFLHPLVGMGLANYFSKRSRENPSIDEAVYLGDDNELLVMYAKETLKMQGVEYFVFGHRHLPIVKKLDEKSTYLNTGEWLNYNSFVVFDGEKASLLTNKC